MTRKVLIQSNNIEKVLHSFSGRHNIGIDFNSYHHKNSEK